ncbi:peptidase inhibitor 16 [Pelobates cultripes]|uniref:Peptidase inhibitor 16 n=1 Tax=Pelobates cultripes TaxID=61616 RepID=A0AAD1SCS8_PELCU|nr:peptidase inhibitor 16 [Pelobates cultripes]
MVWATTERIGCGDHFCETIEGYDEPNVYFMVCNYEPPGNFHGLQPYKVGAPCSNCPRESTCNGSLCESDKDLEDISQSPDTIETETESYFSSKPIERVNGMSTEHGQISSLQTTDYIDPSLTFQPTDGVPDLSPIVLVDFSLSTQDVSLTQVKGGTISAQLLENPTPTQRPEDASLTQAVQVAESTKSLENTKLTKSAENGGKTQSAESHINQLMETSSPPLSFQLPVTAYTVPPLTVTKKEKTTTSPNPSQTPSSKDQLYLLNQISNEKAPPHAPHIPAGPTTRSTEEPTKKMLLPTATLIPKLKQSPPSSLKKVKDQKYPQKDRPVKDPPYTDIKPKINKDKALSHQSTNSAKYALKASSVTKSQKWDILSNAPGQTIFGIPISRPHIYRKHIYRPSYSLHTSPVCPYPCVQQPSKLSLMAPLYRKKSQTYSAGQQNVWSFYKPSKKPSRGEFKHCRIREQTKMIRLFKEANLLPLCSPLPPSSPSSELPCGFTK